MKHMWKVTIDLLVAMMLLVSCSSGSGKSGDSGNAGGSGSNSGAVLSGQGSGSDSGSNSGEVVELKFWDMVWGPTEYIETAQKLVEQFNAEHPNIKVTYQSTPWANWYQTFTTAIAAGAGPDISTGAGYQAFQFYDMDAILPIDDVIEELRANGTLDDFYTGAIDTMLYDNHYVAMPWGIDIRVWYYRKDLFEQAGVSVPKTFEEFREAMKKLSGNGKYGLVVHAVDNGGVQFLLTTMINNGGGIFTEDKKVDFMNERNIETFRWIADMVKDGSIDPASTGYKQEDATKAFGSGTAAVHLTTPSFKDELPELADKLGIIPPMEGLHGDKGSLRWVNNIMIYSATKHPEEAKTFLKWWIENNKPLWTEGHTGQLPVRISVAQDPYFQEDPILKQVLDEYVPIGKPTGTHYPAAFPELNEIEGEGVLHTLSQEVLLGKDPVEAMEKAEKRFKEIMREQ